MLDGRGKGKSAGNHILSSTVRGGKNFDYTGRGLKARWRGECDRRHRVWENSQEKKIPRSLRGGGPRFQKEIAGKGTASRPCRCGGEPSEPFIKGLWVKGGRGSSLRRSEKGEVFLNSALGEPIPYPGRKTVAGERLSHPRAKGGRKLWSLSKGAAAAYKKDVKSVLPRGNWSQKRKVGNYKITSLDEIGDGKNTKGKRIFYAQGQLLKMRDVNAVRGGQSWRGLRGFQGVSRKWGTLKRRLIRERGSHRALASFKLPGPGAGRRPIPVRETWTKASCGRKLLAAGGVRSSAKFYSPGWT